jgi:hypothetical protein
VGWAHSPEDLPPAFVALKLVPVVIGLVMAVRLRRFGPGGGPPMPVAVDPPVVSRFPRSLPPPPRPDLT